MMMISMTSAENEGVPNDSSMDEIEKEMELIVEEVNKWGITYPGEISRNTMISKERVIGLIYKLLKAHRIYNLMLHPRFIPKEMRPRFLAFIQQGIHGYEMFVKVMWLIPNAQIPFKDYAYGEKIKTDEEWMELFEEENV